MSKITQALYPYQRDDVEFLLDKQRAIDGNPMGLGKTIEALAVLEQLNLKHTLIVCKHAYINEWFNQVTDWIGKDCLTPWEGPRDKLDGLNLAGPPYVCINYDLLARRNYFLQLKQVPWQAIVFDEAHKIKNHKADRTKNAYLLGHKVPYIYHLTGTPIQNSPADLFPLFHLIKPRDYSNYHAWINMFCVMEEQEIWMRGPNGKPFSRIVRNIVQGERNHVEELNVLLHMYMCRHEKRDVMPNLPPKQRRTIPVELGAERKQYETMQDELFAMLDSGETVKSVNVAAQLVRLRQICLEPNLLSTEDAKIATPSNKTQALLDLIDDADEKVLVFSFFEQYIRLLSKVLTERKIKHVTITGKRSPTENSLSEKQFQSDPETRVCMGTVGSMGECWTLTEAKIVVFTDLFWNPAINEQCEDRSWGRVNKGLGQSDKTLIVDLFNINTVEEHVHEVVRRKTEMIHEVVDRDMTKEILERMRGMR